MLWCGLRGKRCRNRAGFIFHVCVRSMRWGDWYVCVLWAFVLGWKEITDYEWTWMGAMVGRIATHMATIVRRLSAPHDRWMQFVRQKLEMTITWSIPAEIGQMTPCFWTSWRAQAIGQGPNWRIRLSDCQLWSMVLVWGWPLSTMVSHLGRCSVIGTWCDMGCILECIGCEGLVWVCVVWWGEKYWGIWRHMIFHDILNNRWGTC